jgi:tetratricopeptide (TPR) repeat protein
VKSENESLSRFLWDSLQSDEPHLFFWTSLTLKLWLDFDSISFEAESIKLCEALIRRLSPSISEPVFHILHSFYLRDQDFFRENDSFSPSKIFSLEITSPCSSLLRFVVTLVEEEHSLWTDFSWCENALSWFFAGLKLDNAVLTDVAVCELFLVSLCGWCPNVVSPILDNWNTIYFPQEDALLEHELYLFETTVTAMSLFSIPRPLNRYPDVKSSRNMANYSIAQIIFQELAQVVQSFEVSDSLAINAIDLTLRLMYRFPEETSPEQSSEIRLNTLQSCREKLSSVLLYVGQRSEAHSKSSEAIYFALLRLLGMRGCVLDNFVRNCPIEEYFNRSSIEHLLPCYDVIGDFIMSEVNRDSQSIRANLSRGATPTEMEDFSISVSSYPKQKNRLFLAEVHYANWAHVQPFERINSFFLAASMYLHIQCIKTIPSLYLDEEAVSRTFMRYSSQQILQNSLIWTLFHSSVDDLLNSMRPEFLVHWFDEVFDILEKSQRNPLIETSCFHVFAAICKLLKSERCKNIIAELLPEIPSLVDLLMDRGIRFRVFPHMPNAGYLLLSNLLAIAKSESEPLNDAYVCNALATLWKFSGPTARLEISKDAPNILSNFKDAGSIDEYYDSMCAVMEHAEAGLHEVKIQVFYLEELAFTSEYLRARAILKIFDHFTRFNVLRNPVVELFSKSFAESREEFLMEYFPLLLFEKCKNQTFILSDDFPWEAILGDWGAAEKRNLYEGPVCKALVANMGIRGLADLAEHHQIKLFDLVSIHFEDIISVVIPKCCEFLEGSIESNNEAVQIMDIVGRDTYNTLMSQSYANIVRRIFLSSFDTNLQANSVFGDDASFLEIKRIYLTLLPPTQEQTLLYAPHIEPSFPVRTVLRSLQHLGEQSGMSLPKVFDPQVIIEILQSIHFSLIKSSCYPYEQRHWFHLFRIFLCLVPQQHLNHPFVLKYLMTALICLLKCSSEKSMIPPLIQYVIKSLGNYRSSPYLLSLAIPELAQCATRYLDVQVVLVQICSEIQEFHNDYLLSDVKLCPPFEPHAVLSPLRTWRAAYLSKLGLHEDEQSIVYYFSKFPLNLEVREQLQRAVSTLTPCDAHRVASTICGRGTLNVNDVILLGRLFPAYSRSDGIFPSSSRGLINGPYATIATYVLDQLNNFSSGEILPRCLGVMSMITPESLKATLSDDESDHFSFSLPPRIERKNSVRRNGNEGMVTELWSSTSKSYSCWLISLLTSMASQQPNLLFQNSLEIANLDMTLAESLFPHVIESYTGSRTNRATQIISALKDMFKNWPHELKNSLKICLNLVSFLSSLKIYKDLVQEMDHFDLAQSAYKCKLVHEAIHFAEIEFRRSPSGSEAIQKLLVTLYNEINEPDSFYGVSNGIDFEDLLVKFEHEKEWSKLLRLQESHMFYNDPGRGVMQRVCMETMEKIGFHHILLDIPSKNNGDFSYKEMQCRSLWRNQCWDIHPAQGMALGFNGHIYEIGKALNAGNFSKLSSLTNAGLQTVANELSSEILEGVIKLNSKKSKRNLLHGYILSNLTDPLFQTDPYKALQNPEIARSVCSLKDVLDFSNLDLVLSVQQSLQLSVSKRDFDIYRSLKHAAIARKTGNYHHALHIISGIERLNLSTKDEIVVLYSKSKLYRLMGESKIALRFAEKVIEKATSENDDQTLARLLHQTGIWHGFDRSKSQSMVLSNYLEKAVALNPEVAKYRHTLAVYAHKQYEAMQQSENFSHVLSQRETKRKDLEAIQLAKQGCKSTSEMKRLEAHAKKIQKQVDLDTIEIDHHSKLAREFVLKSIENYLKALSSSDRFDLSIYALCSLWLSHTTSIEVNSVFSQFQGLVSRKKFLAMAGQLTARIGAASDDPSFQQCISSLVQSMTDQYPHHILYSLFALYNGNVVGYEKGYQRSKILDEVVSRRITSVRGILHTYASSYPEVFRQYSQLVESYIELSYYNKAKAAAVISMDSSLKITKLGFLSHVPITTLNFNPNCNLGTIPTIRSFKSKYRLVGGINLPKVVEYVYRLIPFLLAMAYNLFTALICMYFLCADAREVMEKYTHNW